MTSMHLISWPPVRPPYISLPQTTHEWQTRIFFSPMPHWLDIDAEQYVPPPLSHWSGYRMDPSGLPADLLQNFHDGYYIREQPEETKFGDTGLTANSQWFAGLDTNIEGLPDLRTNFLTVSSKAIVTGFLRPLPDRYSSEFPRRSFKMNTRYGMQDWFELTPVSANEAGNIIRVFKAVYDPSLVLELPWCERGLERWPFSFEASIFFHPDATFEVSATTFLEVQNGPYPPVVREYLLHASILSAWMIKWWLYI